MLEAMFGAVWFCSPRLIKTLLSRAAYYVCNELDGFTAGRTTCTRIAAGNAIAAIEMFDIERAISGEYSLLPNPLYSTLASFTQDEWEEVLAIAESSMDMMAGDLQEPRWSHLRKAPG